MAITILPREETLASQLGSGLGQGLSNLAMLKLQDLSQRQQQQRLGSGLQALGFQPEVASQLALLPESALREIVKGQLLAPQQQAYASALGEILGQPQGQPMQDLGLPTGQPQLAGQALQGITQPQVSTDMLPQPEGQRRDILPLAQPRLTERQAEKLAELSLKKQEVARKEETRRQKAIDEANRPFLQNLQKGVPVAEEMYDKANEMLKLLEGGKVTTGLVGKITPGVFLNPESQRFLALSNDIAAILAANSGVATNFKIKFAQERKPNLAQKKQTQIGLTKDLIKQAGKILEREKIANQLIAENNYQQPPNLKSQVDALYRKKQKTSESLPNPDEYSPDAIIEVGGKLWGKSGNEWVENPGIQ